MTEPKEEPTASEELREAVTHLMSAARKVAKGAEPTVQRSLEEAERALDKVGREGEAVAEEVSREVASFAGRLADRLRAFAERDDARRNDPPGDKTDKG
jgi:hypothetical protein